MEPLTVLIVDDEPDMRFYLRSCLSSLAAEIGSVLEAGDGLEALPMVRSGSVHLVVSEVALPRLDGYELCRIIKRDPRLRHVAVLLIGGGPEGSAAAAVGADGFLEKPFNSLQLRSTLGDLPLEPPRSSH